MVLTTLPLALCAVLFIYALGLAIYRLFFHPLAAYPGPFLAKLTDLHSAYHAWKGDRHLEFWRAHDRYGPIVRFGPNSLSFNTNSSLRDIYSFKANVRKADFYSAFPPNKHTFNTHSTIDKVGHARKRRVLANAFSDNAIREMEQYVLRHVRTFCKNLGEMNENLGESTEKDLSLAANGENVRTYDKYLLNQRNSITSAMEEDNNAWTDAKNLSDQANYMTFDVMGDLCFGKAFGMLEHAENRFAIDMIGNAAQRHLICGTYLPIHQYHLDRFLFRKIANGRKRYMQYSRAQAAERTKMGNDVDRKDFFYHLLKAKDPQTGKGFTTAELWGESNLLIIAGSDTTSTALAATFFYLVHNPAKLQKAAREVRSAFADVEDIRMGPTLSSLHYLRACIDEAMRLSPSVGGILPRQVLAGGSEIDGHFLPEGTVVGTPHYAIHHHPDYYPRPFDFIPERWIADSESWVTPEAVQRAQSAFCAFSIGPRGCIGKGMAYVELSLALARALYSYDVRLAPGSHLGEGSPDLGFGRHRPSEFQLIDTFTSAKDGPMVQFRRRAGD